MKSLQTETLQLFLGSLMRKQISHFDKTLNIFMIKICFINIAIKYKAIVYNGIKYKGN